MTECRLSMKCVTQLSSPNPPTPSHPPPLCWCQGNGGANADQRSRSLTLNKSPSPWDFCVLICRLRGRSSSLIGSQEARSALCGKHACASLMPTFIPSARQASGLELRLLCSRNQAPLSGHVPPALRTSLGSEHTVLYLSRSVSLLLRGHVRGKLLGSPLHPCPGAAHGL